MYHFIMSAGNNEFIVEKINSELYKIVKIIKQYRRNFWHINDVLWPSSFDHTIVELEDPNELLKEIL